MDNGTMRLKKHLNEAALTSPEEMVEILQRDCAPWLKEIKGADGFLWRTLGGVLVRDIEKRTMRRDRLPRDTNPKVSDMVDVLHKKHHGFRARSRALFCWSVKPQNPANLVFPIGKFKYVYPNQKQYSDIFNWLARLFDLTDEEQKEMIKKGEAQGHKINAPWTSWPRGEWHEHLTQMRKNSIEAAIKKGYSTKNIKSILNQGYMREVMVQSDTYYLVSSAYNDRLLKEVWL